MIFINNTLDINPQRVVPPLLRQNKKNISYKTFPLTLGRAPESTQMVGRKIEGSPAPGGKKD